MNIGVGGKVRFRSTTFRRVGPQLMLQNLLIGGETLPWLIWFFFFTFLLLTYAAYGVFLVAFLPLGA